MKSFVKNFCIVSIPSLIVLWLVFEFIVFRLLIIPADWFFYEFDEEFNILKFDTVASTGYYSQGPLGQYQVMWEINKDGWVSNVAYEKQEDVPTIGIIGDSYIEAKQVNTSEAYPQLLNDELGAQTNVYSFGISGSPFSNYLQMSKYAVKNFDPEILIINLVHNDFSESFFDYSKPNWTDVYWTYQFQNDQFVFTKPKLNHIDKTHAVKSWKNDIKLTIKNSSTYRYLNLNITKNLTKVFTGKKKSKRLEGNIAVGFSHEEKTMIINLTRHILEEFKKEFPDKRIIFVMDAPRPTIYGGELEKSQVIWLNQLMSQYCQTYDFELIDLTEVFFLDYQRNKIKFEFEKDGHWNAYAHRLVANTIANYLSENQ